jgi:TP901 family phage tail tape measure protein
MSAIRYFLQGDNRHLDATLSKSERRFASFGRKTASAFTRIGRTINTASDRYLTRFNSLLGGAALTLAAKRVIELDSRIARLAIQSGRAGKEFFGLKKELFEVAKATHQSPDELISGLDAIVERIGDIDSAVKVMKEMGIVSTATGTAMEDIGATVSNLIDKMGVAPKEVFNVLDILNVQAKSGAISLAKFAPQIERLAAASGRFNVQGEEGIRVLGAWVQMAKKGSSGAEQATTSIEGAIAELLDPEKIKKVRKLTGFNPIDVEATRRAGHTVMKDLETVLKGVIRGSRGDERILGQIFGRESIRAITDLARRFRETGRFEFFDELVRKGGDGTTTMKDFAFFSEQTVSSIRDLRTEVSRFSNEKLAGPIEALTKALRHLNEHPAITSGGIYALLGLGGVALGSKVLRGPLGLLAKLFGRRKGAAGKIGGLGLPGMDAPLPVYVVNAGFGGMGGGAAGAAGAAGRLGSLARLGVAGLPFAIPLAAYYLSREMKKKGSFNPLRDMPGTSTLVPEHGTARTHAVDDIIRRAAEGRALESTPGTKAENFISLNIQIDGDRRVFTEVSDMSTRVETRLDAGGF